jgi:hypothetical protein
VDYINLFDTNEKYTDYTTAIEDRIYHALGVIFNEAMEDGVKIRELSHLAHLTVYDLELDAICSNERRIQRPWIPNNRPNTDD